MTPGDFKYLGFLGIVFLGFHLLAPGLPRRLFLLAASYYFYYALAQVYLVILLGLTVLTYCGARFLRTFRRPGVFFALLVALVLAPMLFFKYGIFLLKPEQIPLFTTVFPIGISFFTFVAIGYLCDVYLEIVEPEKGFFRTALFLSFFPLVSAGPIERSGRFLPQLNLTSRFSSAQATAGLRLIFWGLVMKNLIANQLQGPVDALFAHIKTCSPLEQLSGVIHYMFYLYADFGGYSLIAIGSAKLLGLEVRPNFHQPFLSTTIPEFWRNWHISLSSWVRDYLFSPLHMYWRHHGRLGMAAALLFSFAILGAWHGAHWGYLIFGIMHGLLAMGSTFTLERRNAFWTVRGISLKILYWPRVVGTFVLLILTYVPFRANSLNDAVTIYHNLFSIHLWSRPFSFHYILGWEGWAMIAALFAGDILVRRKTTLENAPRWAQCLIYGLGLSLLLYQYLSDNALHPFQYYKF